jgi:peptide/nickel transport system substrate-binding protein
MAASGNVLRMGMGAEVLTLDPIKTVYGPDIIAQGIMFSRLQRANADRSQVTPGLAESTEISEDGLTYTFHLADAQFSDGSPITAEDVAFSYTRMRFQKDSAYVAPFDALAEAKAVDAKTVVMTLSRRFTPFLTLTEIWNSGIVPKADVEKKGDEEFARNPVSSGAFRLVEWRQGDRVILEKNPNYYRSGLPHLDGIELIYVPDDNTRMSMIQAGELDMMLSVPAPRVQELIDLGFRAQPELSSVTNCLLINHSAEPFSDLKVRQAVSIAIDRAAIAQTVTSGFAQPASSVMSPALDFFNKTLSVPARDVQKAKSILTEAGKAGLTFDLMIAAGIVDDERAAVLIQSQCAEAGITVNIAKVDSTQAWNRLVEGEYQATLNWWYNETRDPDSALRWAVCGSCGNQSYFTRFNDERVNQLIELAAAETDAAKRQASYAELQQITYDQVAYIPLYYPPYFNAYSPRVKDLILNPHYQFSFMDETSLS